MQASIRHAIASQVGDEESYISLQNTQEIGTVPKNILERNYEENKIQMVNKYICLNNLNSIFNFVADFC